MGCHSRDANEQGEVGACHVHGESIGARHVAGDRLEDSQGRLFERKADGRMAEVPPRQRVAVGTRYMLEAAGACDPRQAGTASVLPAREATIVDTFYDSPPKTSSKVSLNKSSYSA